MRIARRLFCLVAVIWWVAALPTRAGDGWLFASKKASSRGYSPTKSRYVVVDPASDDYADDDLDSSGQNPDCGNGQWRVRSLTAAHYPWGWFGAKRRGDRRTHVRYYGTTQDWNLSWGH